MPHRHLPKNPNLRHLRNQARDLMRGHRNGDPAVLQRIREFHPKFRQLTDAQIQEKGLLLSEAQFAIAREYMFESWPKLRAAIESGIIPNEDLSFSERIPDDMFRQAVQAIDAGDVERLRHLLDERPTLVRQHAYFNSSDYFGQPGLLQFVAQNPLRQRTMPNAVAIAKTIIDAGATKSDLTDTLGLVATGMVARLNHVQIELINLLCEHGAEIPSLTAAVAHGEFQAAEALIRHGGHVTLPITAAFGWTPQFESLLPDATAGERHLAIAFSAQFGRVAILKRLLESGEDPNRYNPPGAHAHSTPLHQAAIHEQTEAVRVLLKAGARSDIPDTLFRGTAIDWSEHANLPEMVSLLKSNV